MSYHTDRLKQAYGTEYPEAVTLLGMRLPLKREGRFLRYYHSDVERHSSVVSKFEDGSASITLAQLRTEWRAWSEADRHEFANAISGLQGHGDYADILRFLMDQADPMTWSCVASQVAAWLPADDAFNLLKAALARVPAPAANITQAISMTRHPEAAGILRSHLHALWDHPNLWDDDPFTNWHAFDAICCIDHLIQLGASPAEYREHARALSAHACAGTRESCEAFLGRYYEWMPKSDAGHAGP